MIMNIIVLIYSLLINLLFVNIVVIYYYKAIFTDIIYTNNRIFIDINVIIYTNNAIFMDTIVIIHYKAVLMDIIIIMYSVIKLCLWT